MPPATSASGQVTASEIQRPIPRSASIALIARSPTPSATSTALRRERPRPRVELSPGIAAQPSR